DAAAEGRVLWRQAPDRGRDRRLAPPLPRSLLHRKLREERGARREALGRGGFPDLRQGRHELVRRLGQELDERVVLDQAIEQPRRIVVADGGGPARAVERAQLLGEQRAEHLERHLWAGLEPAPGARGPPPDL